MGATYIGYSGTDLVSETTYEEQKNGLATFTRKTKILPTTSLPTPSLSETISIGSKTLRLVSFNTVSGNSGFSEIVEIYQGQGATSEIQQNAVISTSDDPIETNRNFYVSKDGADSIVEFSGGSLTEGQAVNATTGGAVFDASGKFLYFNKNAKGNLFGVQSYLNPNLTYRRSFTTVSAPNISAVGKIVSADTDFPASTVSGTWLCTGIQYVQRGGVFEVSQDFRLSGRDGWNEYIYGAITAPPPAY